MPPLLHEAVSLSPVPRRLIPRFEESLDDCGYLFQKFSECLGSSGSAGIVAIHFDQAQFNCDAIANSVALFMRITGNRLAGRIEGGYKTGAGEFFLLLAPVGHYTEELFREDIE